MRDMAVITDKVKIKKKSYLHKILCKTPRQGMLARNAGLTHSVSEKIKTN